MNVAEKTIVAVREYPELYDYKHPHYYDMVHKELLWEKIAKGFQEDSAIVKKRWTYLRDCYRKSLRKRKNGELIRFPNKQWKYEKEMSFLDNHFWFTTKKAKHQVKTRDQDTRAQAQADDEDRPISEKSLQDIQDISELSDVETDRDFMNEEDQNPFEEIETCFVKAEPLVLDRQLGKQGETSHLNKQKTLHTAASSTTASGFQSYLFSESDRPVMEVQGPNNISSFFKYMEETVRSFPPLLQIEIKSKFSQILSEFEMKNLMSQK